MVNTIKIRDIKRYFFFEGFHAFAICHFPPVYIFVQRVAVFRQRLHHLQFCRLPEQVGFVGRNTDLLKPPSAQAWRLLSPSFLFRQANT